jgi:ligand-binding sensor domain-containing protein
MNESHFARRWLFELAVIVTLTTGCMGDNNETNNSPVVSTPSVTQVESLTPAATSAAIEHAWAIIENWTSVNQVRAVLIDHSGDLWTGGPGGVVHWDLDTNQPTIYAIRDNPESTNVVSLLQSPDGTMWVGTFGNGLAKFNGTGWQSFTMDDGLPGNYIVSQTISTMGEIWLVTQKYKQTTEDSHFGRLEGNKWIAEIGGSFSRIAALPNGLIVGAYNYPYHGSFFSSTIAVYDGQMWNDLDIVPDGWIDAIAVTSDGEIWFATLDTIYRYENQRWTTITPPWARQSFPRVSSIAVSADGVAWFGFSLSRFDIDQCGSRDPLFKEQGVYRYDGKTWTHFTTADGLIDNKICTITVDSSGNLWFGSFEKGVSRFDGQEWKSYLVP